jgi:hypothetical protein
LEIFKGVRKDAFLFSGGITPKDRISPKKALKTAEGRRNIPCSPLFSNDFQRFPIGIDDTTLCG